MNMTKKEVACIINESCQSGGQNLLRSSMACAAVAAWNATINLGDKPMRKQICNKTTRQYMDANKEPNKLVSFRDSISNMATKTMEVTVAQFEPIEINDEEYEEMKNPHCG